MDESKAVNLLQKYLAGHATDQEKAMIDKWYSMAGEAGEITDVAELDRARELMYSNIIAVLQTETPVVPMYKKILFKLAAAAVIFFIAGSAYFYLGDRTKVKISETTGDTALSKNDVAPGGNKATLTLANGTSILLDSVQTGALATQGDAQVSKLKDGQIAYTASTGGAAEIAFNTISTPRGGQYQLTLSDGTKVWLNAASSLHYPATFSGKERRVELKGEAYFEVAHNAAMPFKVNVSGKEEVEVLGTHFNINSYSDEPLLKTTLLEGSVKIIPVVGGIISGKQAMILKPGQQAQLEAGGNIRTQSDANIEKVISWKNNVFNFKDENLESVMRQLSRWYNVDIRFEGQTPAIKFSGEIGRNLSLKEVLDILDETRIKYKLQGRTLLITSQK